MLLALYTSTIEHLDAGIDLLNRHDLASDPALQLKVSEHLLMLVDGIDSETSDVAGRIRDLCVFCLGQIAQPDVQSWVSARNVLVTLREGFESVRDEGIQLEAAGSIPPLSLATGQTVLHA